jgi:2-oxoisovalerate dehydrogenase E1 component alpha subunit
MQPSYAYEPSLRFHDPEHDTARPCFRLMDEAGQAATHGVLSSLASEPFAVALYSCMVRLQTMDKVLFDAQRQGRLSFYMTSAGEEAAAVGTSAGLDVRAIACRPIGQPAGSGLTRRWAPQPQDEIFAQYREQGALLWRGHPIQAFVDQCLGNAGDLGKVLLAARAAS